MNNRPKVLIVAKYHQVLEDTLNNLGYEIVFKEKFPYEDALKEIDVYEGVVTSNHLPVDVPLLDRASKLKWIGRLGSGMEIIDQEYAAKKGVVCFSSPGGNANAVAEQALCMLLMLKQNILRANLEVREHLWRRDENRGNEILGMTAGLVGLGHNGSLFAEKLRAMGVNVLAYDIAKTNYGMDGVTGCDDLNLIYEKADFLSFHVPLNEHTYHYFNAEFLDKMRKPFLLLNLSRGPVVEQNAAYQGLVSGKITGAAFDVWEKEPFWKEEGSEIDQQARKMLLMPNFVGTPHIAGYTHEAVYKMSKIISDKVSAFLKK